MTILATPTVYTEIDTQPDVTTCDMPNTGISPTILKGVITGSNQLPHGGVWVGMFLDDFAQSDIHPAEVWLQKHKYLDVWYAWFLAPEQP